MSLRRRKSERKTKTEILFKEVVEMIDKVTIWNKTGEKLEIAVKVITDYYSMFVENEEAKIVSKETMFSPSKELVLEIYKPKEDEEEDGYYDE